MWKIYKSAENLLNVGSLVDLNLDPVSFLNITYGTDAVDSHPQAKELFLAMSKFTQKHIVYVRDNDHLIDILSNQVAQFKDYEIFSKPEFKSALPALLSFYSRAYFEKNPARLALSVAFELFLVYYAASAKISQSSITFTDSNGNQQIAFSPYSLIGFKPDVYALSQKFYQNNDHYSWFDFLNVFVVALNHISKYNSDYEAIERDFGMPALLELFESNADFYDNRKADSSSLEYHENVIFQNPSSNIRFSDFCKKFTFIIQELQKLNFNSRSADLI